MREIKITLPKTKCPSWNEYNRSVHWAVRAAKRQELIDAVTMAVYCNREIKRVRGCISGPVSVRIIAAFKNSNRRDPDNLFVKPIMDGLVKSGIFADDSGKHIREIALSVATNQSENSITIIISEEERISREELLSFLGRYSVTAPVNSRIATFTPEQFADVVFNHQTYD